MAMFKKVNGCLVKMENASVSAQKIKEEVRKQLSGTNRMWDEAIKNVAERYGLSEREVAEMAD